MLGLIVESVEAVVVLIVVVVTHWVDNRFQEQAVVNHQAVTPDVARSDGATTHCVRSYAVSCSRNGISTSSRQRRSR